MNIQSISSSMYRQNFCANQNQPKVVAIALPLEAIENKNILQTLQDVFIPQRLERDVVDIGAKTPEGITNLNGQDVFNAYVDDWDYVSKEVANGASAATGLLAMSATSSAPEEMMGLLSASFSS